MWCCAAIKGAFCFKFCFLRWIKRTVILRNHQEQARFIRPRCNNGVGLTATAAATTASFSDQYIMLSQFHFSIKESIWHKIDKMFCGCWMIDAKSKENGLANGGTGGPPSCDKQQLLGKKTALRDVQNEAQNIIHKPLESPLSKDGGHTADTVKHCGNKRSKPDCPNSPSCSQSPSKNINGLNGHPLYPFKKAELEQGKLNACDIGNTDCLRSRQPNNDKQEPYGLHNLISEPKFSCFPAFATMPVASQTTSSGGPSVPYSLGRPSNGLPISGLNHLIATSTIGTSSLVSPHSGNNPNWQERFLRLQMFLKHCNESSQEEYINMLQSLSAAGRSRQAVELEKRAINLLLDEGKELNRMRALNVLGKSIPVNCESPASQAHPVQQVQK